MEFPRLPLELNGVALKLLCHTSNSLDVFSDGERATSIEPIDSRRAHSDDALAKPVALDVRPKSRMTQRNDRRFLHPSHKRVNDGVLRSLHRFVVRSL